MKTVIKMFPIFSFEELSSEAREKAKQNFLNTELRNWDFQDMVKNQIIVDFPHSDLKIQYSLSYCQGDGVNLYGKLSYLDMLEKIKDNFTEKEMKTLNFCFLTFYGWTPYGKFASEDFRFILEVNHRYSYCKSNKGLFKDDVVDEMEYEYMRNIPYDLLDKFASLANSFIHKYCSDIEESGYKYLYEIPDKEMEEISYFNDWMYLEDGTLYGQF